jgi:hypothetical protein
MINKNNEILITKTLIGSIKPEPLSFEAKTIMIEVELSKLKVDRSYYQRDFNEPRALKISKSYTPLAERVILVAKRKDTETLYIVDGQHTVAALRMIGHTKYKVKLLVEPTTVDQERELFARCNDEIKNVHTRLKLKNHFNMEKPGIKDINKIVTKNGFSIYWEDTKRNANSFDCIVRIVSLYDYDDGKHLDSILNFMHQAWCYTDEFKAINMKDLVSSKFLSGVSDFFKRYKEELDSFKVRERLLKICREKTTAKGVIQRASIKGDNISLALLDLYNSGLKTDLRLKDKY